MAVNDDRRVVVEIFSHPEAERLRQELRLQDEIHRAEISRLEARLDGLHRTFYDYLDSLRKSK